MKKVSRVIIVVFIIGALLATSFISASAIEQQQQFLQIPSSETSSISIQTTSPTVTPTNMSTNTSTDTPTNTPSTLQPKSGDDSYIVKEDFNSISLSTAWTVNESSGHGRISLADNPGYLRYYLTGRLGCTLDDIGAVNRGWTPSTCMKRSFRGSNWEFETKMTYKLKYPGTGAQISGTHIIFGNDLKNNLYMNRLIDSGYSLNSNEFNILFSDSNQNIRKNIIAPNDTIGTDGWVNYTYWYRVVRNGKSIKMFYSYDGINYSLGNEGTLPDSIDDNQSIALDMENWADAGSYYDCDYIYVKDISTIDTSTPTPSAPRDGLMGEWLFNGNASDTSGNENNGVVNGATLTTDRFGRQNSAYSFSGKDSYINLGNSEKLRVEQNEFTYSMWIKCPISNINYSPLYTIRNSLSGYPGDLPILRLIIKDNKPCMYMWNVDNFYSLQGNTSINDDCWHHIVLKRSLDNVAIYIDGKIDTILNACTKNATTDLGEYWIGGSSDSCTENYYFNGLIDDIRIYNKALNDAEVDALFNEKNSSPVPKLQPKGYLDSPSQNKTVSGILNVAGWFLDINGVSKIEVLIDNKVTGKAVYGSYRPDVKKVYPEYGNENCGFMYNLDTNQLTAGTHSIVIRETGNDGKVTELPIRNIIINKTPTIGSIDRPTNSETIGGIYNVRGWFLDAKGVSKIEVLVDNELAGTATYGISRPDVMSAYPAYNNSNSGFSFELDTANYSEGTHSIAVRETSNNGVVTTLPAKTVTFSRKLPAIGYIDYPSANEKVTGIYNIKGWFLDTEGIAKLEVVIDSVVVGEATYGTLRSDVMKVYPLYNNPNCGYSYILDTSSLSDGTHTVTIRETSKSGGVVNSLPLKYFTK